MTIPITNASFNLTQGCNLRCSYCFTYGQTAKRMPFDVGRRCIDFLIRNAKNAKLSELNGGKRAVDISFWGGEPLLEWKLLKDLVSYAESRRNEGVGISFSGTTNGVLLTEDKFSFLEDHRVFFMISIDGTQETHDRYRTFMDGKGSHAIIMRNMEKVLKKWPFYKVRMSPYAEGIHRFYEDVRYLVDNGIYNIMFSPVYESGWTEERWKIWEEEGYRVVDLIAEKRKNGIKVEIEHFKSYTGPDRSSWPCGAGRFYVGFDVDGAIYPCHRFNKFTDKRNWREKEVCIGHIDHGITRPEFREQFIDFKPTECNSCEFFATTPCHGGCYAVNFDLAGNIQTPPRDLCRYVKVQSAISAYYKEKVGMEINRMGRSCICYNMCYMENTEEEVIDVDGAGLQCHCYNTNYTGPLDEKTARPLDVTPVTPYQVMELLHKLEKRVFKIEEYIMLKEGKKE